MERIRRWIVTEVIRVSPHGLLCGVLMSVWCYWLRDVDLPIPLIATVVAIPYYAVVGFLARRRRDASDDVTDDTGDAMVGVVVGAAVAGIGFLVVCAAVVVIPTHATGAWRDPLTRLQAMLLYGPVFLLPVVALGLMCGAAGAALAHARLTDGSAREE